MPIVSRPTYWLLIDPQRLPINVIGVKIQPVLHVVIDDDMMMMMMTKNKNDDDDDDFFLLQRKNWIPAFPLLGSSELFLQFRPRLAPLSPR